MAAKNSGLHSATNQLRRWFNDTHDEYGCIKPGSKHTFAEISSAPDSPWMYESFYDFIAQPVVREWMHSEGRKALTSSLVSDPYTNLHRVFNNPGSDSRLHISADGGATSVPLRAFLSQNGPVPATWFISGDKTSNDGSSPCTGQRAVDGAEWHSSRFI